jgi:hypothetical protein
VHSQNSPSPATSDAELIGLMQTRDRAAWSIFEARFKPILTAYARRAKIPPGDWPVCVFEVLEDEGLRLSARDTEPPINLAAYLIAAVRHRYLRVKRAQACRDKNYDAAADDQSGEWVVASLCSEDALRASRGPGADTRDASTALRRLASELRAGLTIEEESILVWVSERVPHAQIATWLGMSYDACTKRIWRLCRRLRSETSARRASYSSAEQAEIDRFIRRATGSLDLRGRVASATNLRSTHEPQSQRGQQGPARPATSLAG